MKSLLIIGGTGVLSSAVTEEALRQGISVTMINRGNRIIPTGVSHIKANKEDYQLIASSLGNKKFDAVMDYLCFTDEETQKSIKFYSNYTKQYFFISSCAVYDTKELKGTTAEENSKKVLSEWKYSIDKWKSELKLKELFDGTDVNYTIIRPSITYGDTRIPYGFMPPYGFHWTICERILSGKPIITWNGGNNRSNMMRVEDFAIGAVALIGNSKAYGEAFNICGDESPSFREVIDIVSNYLNKKVITIDISSEFYAKEFLSRGGEILGRSYDAINSNKKIKSIVPNFRQNYSIKDGILKTLEAYKNNNYQKGIDWKFDAETDRIIKKWYKRNGRNNTDIKIGFIDYQHNATFKDRAIYWLTYHRDSVLVKLLLKIRKV